jgi:phosphoribosylaminoimidazolecarboxamide formyltransferase / IMP cyclohydrolase
VTKPRALLSVYDKTGVVDFARSLVELGFEVVSSGGTSAALATAGVEHLSVEDVTGFPEMLDGRVKTLHPRLHGGILADRSKPEHLAAIADHDIVPIDIVACNLYPFSSNPSIELIDVGGPSMVRAAAKNHGAVTVLVDPADYAIVLRVLTTSMVGGPPHPTVDDATRQHLAAKAFAHTGEYDTAIAAWFAAGSPSTPPVTNTAGPTSSPDPTVLLNDWQAGSDTPGADDVEAVLPSRLTVTLERAEVLRYGENPHQRGARYRTVGTSQALGWWDSMVRHGGKGMSYLNVFDADAAWRLVHDLGHGSGNGSGNGAAAAIIKHANPCGAAVASDLATAYNLAHSGDLVSAFGGIVALNQRVTLAVAEALAPIFSEVVIAPSYDEDALRVLTAKKNLRVLSAPAPHVSALQIRTIDGGLLIQEADDVAAEANARRDWRVAGKVQPTDAQWQEMTFAWKLSAHVSSNAIVLTNGGQAVGIGAGQQSRVDAAQIAVRKAGERAKGGVCASDAFFPFRDGLDLVASTGISAVIEPGGSVRDDEVIEAANEHNIALVFTGRRHFKH